MNEPEKVLKTLLKDKGITISTAESCTGGRIASLITSVPGASEYFLGSVVSYAVTIKEEVLGVPPEVIEQYGVVSEEVARAMAEGVRNLTGSTYSVSTTGLAGPGGDERNPVGTVCIGICGPEGTRSFKKTFFEDRSKNIEQFATAALEELVNFIKKDLKHSYINYETIMLKDHNIIVS